MTIELAETVPDAAGGLERYPTPRQIVDAALGPDATLGAGPTGTARTTRVPCEDSTVTHTGRWWSRWADALPSPARR